MKRFLPVSAFLILAFSGCFTEYVYTSTCVYKNQTDESICFTWHSHDARHSLTEDTVFIIPPQGSHALKFWAEGHYPLPFCGDHMSPNPGDSIVVSNGEKQVIHKFYPPDPETNNLYQIKTYTLVQKTKRHITFEYIFTDTDFADTEPSAPMEPHSAPE